MASDEDDDEVSVFCALRVNSHVRVFVLRVDSQVSVIVKPLRNVIDPLDQNRDICNCIDFLLEEKGVDQAATRKRLGSVLEVSRQFIDFLLEKDQMSSK